MSSITQLLGSFRGRYETLDGKDSIPPYKKETDGRIGINPKWADAPFEEVFVPHDLYTRTPEP